MAKPGEIGGPAIIRRRDGSTQIVERGTGRILRETNPQGIRVIRVDARPNPRGGTGRVFRKVDDPGTARAQDAQVRRRQEQAKKEQERQSQTVIEQSQNINLQAQQRSIQQQTLTPTRIPTPDNKINQALQNRFPQFSSVEQRFPSAQPRPATLEPDRRLTTSQIVREEGRGRRGDIAGLRAIEGRSLDRALRIQSDIDSGTGNRLLNELRLQSNVALRDISGLVASTLGTPEIVRNFSSGDIKPGSIGPALATEDTRFRSAPLDVLGVVLPLSISRAPSRVVNLPASTRARMGSSTPMIVGPDSIPVRGGAQLQLSPRDIRSSNIVFDPVRGAPSSFFQERVRAPFSTDALGQRTLSGGRARDRFNIIIDQDPIRATRTTTQQGNIDIVLDGPRRSRTTQTTFGGPSDQPFLVAATDGPSGSNVRIISLETRLLPPSLPARRSGLFGMNRRGQSNIFDTFDTFQDFFETSRRPRSVSPPTPQGLPDGFRNPFITEIPGRSVGILTPATILRSDQPRGFSGLTIRPDTQSDIISVPQDLRSIDTSISESRIDSKADTGTSQRSIVNSIPDTSVDVRSRSRSDTVVNPLLEAPTTSTTDSPLLPPRTTNIPRPRDTPDRIPRPPRLPISLRLPRINLRSLPQDRVFRFSIGKPGNKIFNEFTSRDLRSGVLRARGKVDSTLAASFRVDSDEPLSRDDKRLIDGLLGSNFRRGRNDTSRFVERRGKRLSTRTETLSIASSRKDITKGNNFSRALGLVNRGFSLRNIRRML